MGRRVPADVEILVVGAGAVGLAIGQAFAKTGTEVIVLEQHERIGTETSARNSEVIHAGLYYPPGSLKARLSVAGNRRLHAFAAENGIRVLRTGKLLLACDEKETNALERIAATARANGVGDLMRLSRGEVSALEPEVRCWTAYLSPSTSVIDSHAYLEALEGHLTAAAGRVVLNTRVTGLARRKDQSFEIATESAGTRAVLTARRLVLAAGLEATRLGRHLTYLNHYRVPETYLAKGHYFALKGPPPFERLVYPMPRAGSLGIHFTRDAGGGGKFGPDIEWKGAASDSAPDYSLEDADGARCARFESAIRRYWPGLPDGALAPGYTGLRPKLSRPDEPAADFAIHGEAIHGIANLVALYGIESPGLTSSLAIGAYVADLMARS